MAAGVCTPGVALAAFVLKGSANGWRVQGYAKGQYWSSSYSGTHYSVDKPSVNVFFNTSDDGMTWRPASPESPVVYTGGVSEVGW